MPNKPMLLNTCPDRPRAVFRIGFAGRKDLSPDAERNLRRQLLLVLNTIGRRLAAITPAVPIDVGTEPKVAQFFAHQCPLLRLITGLCEGADLIAAQVLDEVRIVPPDSAEGQSCPTCLEKELAAIVPFALKDYRHGRPAEFRGEFDRQLARCAYVVELDGKYEKPIPDTPLAKRRRNKGYRAQSAVLIRQADLIVAALDPEDPGKAGGTMETVRAALAFDLPVVLIHTGTSATWLIPPGEDLMAALADDPKGEEHLRTALAQVVSKIVANPDIGIQEVSSPEKKGEEAYGLRLLDLYFDRPTEPPLKSGGDGKAIRRVSCREKFWTEWIDGRFSRGVKPKSDMTLAGYATFRTRATNLNYHFSGLYRGAFLANYVLAVAAVALATTSLLLIGIAHTNRLSDSAAVYESPRPATAVAIAASRPATTPTRPAIAPTTVPQSNPGLSSSTTAPAWLYPTLFALGVLKLSILVIIWKNTEQAKHKRWNDVAVDYRYLAERLRSMFYLPRIGSFQPPAAGSPQYTDRAIHQSAADWLFDAITRSVSPADLATIESFRTEEVAEFPVKLIRPKAAEAVAALRDRWAAEQAKYHHRNALTMGSFYNFTVRWGGLLNVSVIGIVVLDLLILILSMLDLLPATILEDIHSVAPWLILLTAILPAAVAAVNGLRFQTECLRLAQRSAIVRTILGGEPDEPSSDDPPLTGGRWKEADDLAQKIECAKKSADDVAAWSLDVLLLAERIADDFVREVAEWSVLYAKEVPET
jgi:hypothetical protein